MLKLGHFVVAVLSVAFLARKTEMPSKQNILPIWENKSGDIVRGGKISRIEVNRDSINQSNVCIIFFEEGQNILAGEPWFMAAKPVPGEYVFFDRRYKTGPLSDNELTVAQADGFEQDYKKVHANTKHGKKAIPDYEEAVRRERKRVCTIFAKWNMDDGKTMPYEIPELIEKIKNGEL